MTSEIPWEKWAVPPHVFKELIFPTPRVDEVTQTCNVTGENIQPRQ